MEKLIDWAFKALLSGCVIYGVGIISKMEDSISDLNNNVSKIIEKTSWHEKEIDKLEVRVRELEKSKRGKNG